MALGGTNANLAIDDALKTCIGMWGLGWVWGIGFGEAKQMVHGWWG